MLAAKHFDPVLGVDLHLIQPPGPVPPVLIPCPFIGLLFDVFDYVPILGSTIKINGLHRAIGGTLGRTIPGVHFPIGGVFVKPPANQCEMFMGSSTVKMDGDVASYMTLPSLSCQDIGFTAPIRLNPRKRSKIKSLVLPTSVVLPIPYANPVFIGGPPTISLISLGMKLGLFALGKGLRRLAKTKLVRAMTETLQKAKQKAFAWMKPGWLKCILLKAEPVNLVTGEAVVEQQDFELPGRIPFKWTRYYNSGNQRTGLCGFGWETPADARLVIYDDGNVSFHDGQPGAAVFESLPISGTSPVKEIVGGARLRSEAGQLVVRTAEGLEFWFPQPKPGQREVLVQAIRDLCGNAITFTRDDQGGLLAIKDSAGRMLPVISNHGRIDSIWVEDPGTKALKQLVAFHYNETGDLTAVEDALKAAYVFAYAQHRLVRHTDRRKLSFYYEYDHAGRCIHAFGDGRLYDYHFRYYADANLTEVEDSRGNVSVYVYNENKQVVQEWDALGNLTEYEYDDVGRGSAVVDPLGRRTEYLYDESGNLLELKQPDGITFKWQYDHENHVIALTDGNGQVWRNEWNETGRLHKRVSPRGAVWQFEYNQHGDLIRTTNPLGHIYRFEVNRDGSTSSAIDPRNNITRFEVDYLGNVAASIDPAGFRTSYRYDEKSRLSAMRSPAGREDWFWWDAQDDLAAYRDAEGHLFRFEYFGLGELARKIAPDGATIAYEYDTEENLIAVVNERGQRYRIAYDALNRISEEVDYWGHARSYAYDEAGQVRESTNGAGRNLTYKFDLAGRVIERRETANRFTTYQYDGNDNLIDAKNEYVRIQRRYDPEGNLLAEGIGNFLVVNEYDLNGNRVLRKSSIGNEIRFVYDESDYLAAIALNEKPVAAIHRDARCLPVSEVLSSTLRRNFSWDADANLEKLQLRTTDSLIGEQTFLYDKNENLVERRDAHRGATALTYDPLGKLVSYVAPATRALLLAQRLEQGPPGQDGAPATWRTEDASYEFDGAGNLALRRNPQGETRFEWDANNRLVGAYTERGNEVRYAYDPLGRRLSKTVDGRRTEFYWDGDLLLGDNHGGLREFTFYPGTFVPLSLHQGAREFYFHNDPAGLPHDLYTAEGKLAWSARYGAFGDADKLRVVQDNPLRLQGQYYDEETGLHYNRFRYFDPAVGRFISIDPLGVSAGSDLYRYAPSIWNWIDPFGLNCSKDAKILRDNMVAAGIREPKWPNRAHHIVPSNDLRMDAVRKHMASLGVDINSHHNGVFLPASKDLVKQKGLVQTAHPIIHTDVYRDEIQKRIMGETTKAGVQQQLSQIRSQILRGKFPF